MVSRIVHSVALLATLLSVAAQAIDFTPIVPENDSLRMRRFPRLLFEDDDRTISYVRPVGWQFTGSKAGLRLQANDPSHSVATIQAIRRKSPPKFDEESIEALKGALIAALPADSINVSIQSVEKNPLLISGHETLEITVAYYALNLDRIESVLFVNLPEIQLQFALNALKTDFVNAHECFRRSYYTWQWIEQTSADPARP